MKKIAFILVIVLCSSFIVKAQNVLDTIFDKYFLPDFIDVEYCNSLLFYDTINNTQDYMARNHYCFSRTGGSFRTEDTRYGILSGVLDRAQPCYTDTLLTVKGIAIGVNYRRLLSFIDSTNFKIKLLFNNEAAYMDIQEYYNSIPKGKLKLMDSMLDREIISVDIDTNFVFHNLEQCSYMEYYFDSSVNVNGLFYIVEDVTPTSTLISWMVFSECNFDYPSLVRTSDTIGSPWVQWSEHFFNQEIMYESVVKRPSYEYSDFLNLSHAASSPIPNTCQMYMFPIFTESVDDTDVSVYDVNVDRYSFVSPNPASDVVTVQSSFKIREIEIHNSLGQVVLRKEGSQNIETIDVSMLESGVYVVRIKTQRGFANKKLIIK